MTELAKKVQELEDRLAEIEECKRKSDILHYNTRRLSLNY